jgi:LytS/YehU family sensor histidine kinase
MRLVLENSREQEVPLENDLAALELYMQLESLRFAKGFQYEIAIDPDIDKENTLIPPLMLQPFAENAIVHGIKNKEHGLIKINVHAENNNMIRCVVEDNGAGRETPPAAEENLRKRKSLGMKITQERLNIINQLKKAKAAVHIFDLKDAENKPGGLRIELLLPRQLAF